MRAGGRRRIVPVLLAAALSAAGVGCSTSGSAGSNSIAPGADGLLDWMVEHKQDVGLVVLVDGQERLTHRPDEHFPLASAIKVLTLVAYAEQVAAGALDEDATVTLEEVDRLYLAGTDGGAHEAARSEWGDRREVTLDQLTHAMIRYSSNVAADVMLRKVGGPPAALEAAARHGMATQQPPVAIFELFRSWESSNENVRDLAHATPAGTPRGWAMLMEQVRTGETFAAPAAATVRRHLEWPMRLGDNSRLFDRFGTKGGALPGVITEASYLELRDGPAVSVALFLRHLPDGIQAQLLQSYAHQELIRAFAEQPELLTDLAARLRSP